MKAKKNKFTFEARRWDQKPCIVIIHTDNEKLTEDAAYNLADRNLPGQGEKEVILELVSIETVL